MLRFTSQTLLFASKFNKKNVILPRRVSSQNYLQYFMGTAKIRADFSEKLLSGKYYQILGYPQGTDISTLTDTDIKRQYLAMVKKYHSDSVVDPTQKLDNQEITKCIISAFDKISSERIQSQIDKGIYDKIYKDQDQIAMKIYGKKFNEIKYDLFRQGNNAKRMEFMEQLEKIRKQSKFYSHGHEQASQTTSQQSQPRESYRNQNLNLKIDTGSGSFGYIFAALGVAGAVAFYYMSKDAQKQQAIKAERNKNKLTLTPEQIKEIQKKSTQLHDKKLSDLIDSYVDQQPPSLKYPSKQDPHQIQQLIQYTIGPDINIYEVDSKIMSVRQNLEKLKSAKNIEKLKQQFGQKFNLFQLQKAKLNSFITLSLEAQRCLQNIYIKVKDVADEIQQTGKYTPPKIFFRFFGYCMFEIRQKPLSLQNYRDTEYISLFDLFFDYYSPIPLKRHQYNQYVVGLNDDDLKMYGQVHLNHRKLPERYIGRQDKVVVMKDQIPNPKDQQKYEQIWQDFYRKYEKIWLRGYADRISTEHQ